MPPKRKERLSIKKHRAKSKTEKQFQITPSTTTRVAKVAGGVEKMSTSGAAGIPAVDASTIAAFNNMLNKHNVTPVIGLHAPINCAESHLWMTLKESGKNTKRMGISVSKKLKNKFKRDEPCQNCRQWVYKEFGSVNGKMTR